MQLSKPKVRVKADVWIPATGKNLSQVYELAKVVSMDEDKNLCLVKPINGGAEHTISLDEVQLTNPRVVPDMTSLYHINDAGILHNLKVRSEYDLPYTTMGSVLVSVNPLHSVPDPELKPGQAMTDVPHPYAIAEQAFKNMTFCYERRLQRGRQLEILERGGHDIREEAEIELVVNQSVVISGESGSGKTESGKRVLRHLVNRAGCSSSSGKMNSSNNTDRDEMTLDVQLAGVGPILEAFGNASTVCNHNSSRFGKFSKLHFVQTSQQRDVGKTWNLVGATVETYLLEQSRVVNHCAGERNFHVFYQLLTGADAEMKSSLGLTQVKQFNYMVPGTKPASAMTSRTQNENRNDNNNASPPSRVGRRRGSKMNLMDSPTKAGNAPAKGKGGILPLDGPARKERDQQEFKSLVQALEHIGKSKEYKTNLFKIVAGVLHLGNISLEHDETELADAAKIGEDETTKTSFEFASKLLGVPKADLAKLLLTKQVKAGMEVIDTKLNVVAAQYARDALAKWTYGIVFDYLVKEINAVLTSTYEESVPLDELPFIGVLDIFGFESFQKNGFEQLLINYTNESLQSTFNYQVFVAEADLYKREGLLLSSDDNPFICPSEDGDCLDLFEGRPGMTGLLMEIDSESRGPQPTDEKLNRRLHQAFAKMESFPKPHPKDIAKKFLIKHYAGVVEYTIGDFVEKNNDRIPPNMNMLMKTSENPVVEQAFHACGGDGSGKGFRVKKKKTVVANFGGQIRNLVETLESTKCSFIRCVKPNPEMKWARGTTWFNNQYVNEQLKCLSIPQTAAVLKSGLPTRIDYDTIVQAYQTALPMDALEVWNRANANGAKENGRTFVAALFFAFQVPHEAYRLGLSKVFFSNGMIDLLDRIMQEASNWAKDEGKYCDEKLEVARRFKLFYSRMRWRRAYAKVLAINKFLHILEESRVRAGAIRAMQRAIRAFLFRNKINALVNKRIKKRQEEERKKQEQAERERKLQEERNKRMSIEMGTATRAQAASVFQKQESSPSINTANSTRARTPNLTLELGSSPGSKSGSTKNLPPLQKTPTHSGSSARSSFRNSKRLSSGWSLSGVLRTPKGSLRPEFLELLDMAQAGLKEDNSELKAQNQQLLSDLEALKEDIALLKKQTPFTHVLHIY